MSCYKNVSGQPAKTRHLSRASISSSINIAAMAVMLFGSAIASASTGAQAANAPSSTTATYEDWVVRCRSVPLDTVASGSQEVQPIVQGSEPGQQLCEMVQIIRVSMQTEASGPQSQVLAEIAIGKLPGSTSTKMVVQVPMGVWIREPLTLKLAQDNASLAEAAQDNLLTASFFRCQGPVCLADLDVSELQENALKAAKVAQLSFYNGPDQILNVPVSLNGFASAFDQVQD